MHSNLVTYTNTNHNHFTKGRNGKSVDTITIHCTAGNKNSTAKSTVDYFATTTRECSSNYVTGGDGSIGLCVEEENRSWCSGGEKTVNGETGRLNDFHAITIEVASSSDGKEVNQAAVDATIKLCVDIMKRYGKTKAVWFGDNAAKMVSYQPAPNEMKFTWHRWFAAKACPGEYLMNHFDEIINAINAQLEVNAMSTETTTYKLLTHTEFINAINDALNRHAEQYGIKERAAIIAQAIIESAWGTSEKAQHHNYFGLKYRPNRVQAASGKFTSSSKEQNPDGSYKEITTEWFEFPSLDACVEGYLQFINTDRYKNLKGVTNTEEYVKLIREDGYATSLSYVENILRVVDENNLKVYNVYKEEQHIDFNYETILNEARKLDKKEISQLICELVNSLV